MPSVGPKLRLLLLLPCIVLVVISHMSDAKKDLKSACSTCREITENFNKVSVISSVHVVSFAHKLMRVFPDVLNDFDFDATTSGVSNVGHSGF